MSSYHDRAEADPQKPMLNTLSATLTASKEVLSREIHGEIVLLDLKTESYFGVSGVGARIWQMLVDGTNLREMRAVLAAEYKVSEETLAKDLQRFVGDLVDAGLVTAGNDSVSNS